MQKHADRMDKRPVALLGRTAHNDPYGWPKTSGLVPPECAPEVQAHHHQSEHHHPQQQQQCVIPNNDVSRFARQDMDRHGGQGLANNGRASEELPFAPIQSSMLSSATARNAVAAAYFPYESFGFGIGTGGGVDMKAMGKGECRTAACSEHSARDVRR